MVTEMLSAQSGYTVVNADTISSARILVLHLVLEHCLLSPHPSLMHFERTLSTGCDCAFNKCFVHGLLQGGPFLCDPCGKAFTAFAATSSDDCDLIACNIDQLLLTMQQLQGDGPAGVWVSSTQMLLSIPPDYSLDWAPYEVCSLGLPSKRAHA